MITNKNKAIIGIILLFVSIYFISKYDTHLNNNTENILVYIAIIISIVLINPYIYEVFKYKDTQKIEKKRNYIDKKSIFQTVGYIISFIGLYFNINEINYFFFMDMLLIFLGGGIVFYARKYMK
jgi:tellurite resistance protein TehA-like permease